VYACQLDGSTMLLVQFRTTPWLVWYSGVLVIVGAIYLSGQLL
jgi:hypothetical protein